MTDAAACLFCKIAAGDIATDVVHGEEGVTIFRDVNPQAPKHLLLIPNEHIASPNDLRPEHDELVGRLVRTAAEVAAREGIGQSGYRLITNCGLDAGQLVSHLHFHLIGGREMGWPPG